MHSKLTDAKQRENIFDNCMYIASQKRPTLVCYNFDIREHIFIFFGRNVIDKVSNQKALYYTTSNNMCFSTT